MKATNPKAYCSEFQISFRIDDANLIRINNRLLPVRNTAAKKAVAAKLCTKDGNAVVQVYRDEITGKIFEHDQLGRAKETSDGDLELVDFEAIKKAKVSTLPKNTLEVFSFPIEEVDAHFFPSDNQAFVLDPVLRDKKRKPIEDPENMKWFEFLHTIVTLNPGIALVGRGNLQNHEGVFRVGTYQGNLTVQKQMHPEELNQFDLPIPKLNPKTRRMAVELSKRLTRELDPETFNDRITERLAAIQPGAVVPVIEEVEEPVFNLEASLKSMLATV